MDSKFQVDKLYFNSIPLNKSQAVGCAHMILEQAIYNIKEKIFLWYPQSGKLPWIPESKMT